jgi:hypothetical protein
MRSRSRKALSISAAMLSVLSVAFSCNYGDDDDEKTKDRKKVEAIQLPHHSSGVSAARIAPKPDDKPRQI